jgi:hypothetical protein
VGPVDIVGGVDVVGKVNAMGRVDVACRADVTKDRMFGSIVGQRIITKTTVGQRLRVWT